MKSIIKKNKYYILSIILPLLILSLSYYCIGIFPNSEKLILISDMNDQYIDYFSKLYEIIKTGNYTELLYSWSLGMGGGFIGLFAYYLSSPLNIFILLFSKENLPQALYYLTLLKISLCSFTFIVYIKYSFNRNDIYALIFSIIYSLMGFNIIYSFDIMWLDAVILLPLLLIGVERIIKENKWGIFLITLVLAFISQFYMSYIIGIFSFLYFIIKYFSKHNISKKDFLIKIKIFFITTILGIGLSSFLLLPTAFSLFSNSNNEINLMWNLKSSIFTLCTLISRLFIGNYDTITTGGQPNIYCGIIVFILVPMYIMNKKIPKREKVLDILLILFIIISFIHPLLNLMWHGFDSPNWFPHRFSFLLSFMLILVCLKQIYYVGIEPINHKQIFLIFLVQIILIFIGKIILKNISFISNYLLLLSAIFMLIYILIINFKIKLKILLPIFIFLELFFNTTIILHSLDLEFTYQYKDNYNQLNNKEEVIRNTIDMDNNFYRIEDYSSRTFNDSLNIGYNGIQHYSSMANTGLHEFLNQIGLANSNYNSVISYSGSTPIIDSILGVKYIINEMNNTKILVNNHVLSLGYVVSNKLLNIDTDIDNLFDLQNDILNLMIGNEKKDSDYIPYFSEISTEINYINKEDKRLIEVHLNNHNDNIYVFFPLEHTSKIQFIINENKILEYGSHYNNTILNLGKIKENKIIIDLLEYEGLINNIYFYNFNEEQLSKSINYLKKNEIKNLEVKNNKIKGTIKDCDDDEILFTSIPFDSGWSAYINGEKTEILNINNAFIGLPLVKELNEIVFIYIPRGLIPGTLISLISLLILIIKFLFILIKKLDQHKIVS